MSKENEETLKIYDEKAGTYLATSITHDNLDPEKAKRKREKLNTFINGNIGTLPKGAKVFGFGSGDGVNAKYIEDLGYDVTASDVADDFINATKNKGVKTIKFNVLEDNFNEKWGTNLSDDQLIEISCGGMSNSGARGIKIATNVKDVIDYVTYNMDGTDNTTADKSIVYQNQYNSGQFQSVLVSDDRTPTPGRVDSNTKPQYSPVLPDTVSEPVLEDRTASTFHTDEDFAFEIKATSQETTIKTVSLYMKDNKSNGYTQYNLLRNNGDVFNYTLASVDLIGKSSYEYYFVVSDGYQTVTTDVKTVNNEEGTLEGDRFNIDDQTVVSQNQQIIGTGENLILDGKDITGEAKKSISNSAKIAFDASQTDVFFKNAVSIGNDSIGVFNEGTYDSWMTYSYDVDAKYFDYDKKQVTIAFHAGNKANVLEHNIENNDDFVLKNIINLFEYLNYLLLIIFSYL